MNQAGRRTQERWRIWVDKPRDLVVPSYAGCERWVWAMQRFLESGWDVHSKWPIKFLYSSDDLQWIEQKIYEIWHNIKNYMYTVSKKSVYFTWKCMVIKTNWHLTRDFSTVWWWLVNYTILLLSNCLSVIYFCLLGNDQLFHMKMSPGISL